jgi:hypothetical protein
VGDRDAYIVKKETLYYSFSDRRISKVKEKTEMLGLFGERKELIKSFISSNRLGFKNEEDLIKIFSYYNSSKKVTGSLYSWIRLMYSATPDSISVKFEE